MRLSRRAMLGAAGAALVSRSALARLRRRGVGTGGGGGGGGVDPATLTVEVTFPGGSPVAGTQTFAGSGGTDLGSYGAPTAGFTQRCVRARNANIPHMFVDFRPDTTSSRVEVVVWNGECDPANPANVASGYSRDLPSYTVNIKQSGVSLYSATIPLHSWGCRWRYQSAVRPIIRTAANILGTWFPNMNLVAARLSGSNISTGQPWSGKPYSDPSGNIIQPRTVPVVSATYTPFMAPDVTGASTTLASNAAAGAGSFSVVSVAGQAISNHITVILNNGTSFTTTVANIVGTTITINGTLPSAANAGKQVYNGETKLGLVLFVETGGERPELGVMTEWAGDWLLNGTSTSLNAIRQQAEMASSEWPFYLPDAGTGAALNFKSDLTHYKVIIDPVAYGGYYQAVPVGTGLGWDFHEEDSHFQMHPFIAYALTEDSYFLEGCQYLQAYGMGNRGTMLGREGNLTASQGIYGWGDLLGTPNGTGGVNGSFTNCSAYEENRTTGNGCRNLAMNWKIAPTSTPSWLLHQSYYSAVSGDYLKVIDSLYTGGLNRNAIFLQLGWDPYWQVFEQCYGIMGLALGDLYGMPANGAITWLSTLTHFFGMIDNLTNGTSGWDRQVPQPHDIYNIASTPNIPAGELNFQNYATWGALYNDAKVYLQSVATFPTAASPGNRQGGSMGNCNMILAAAACAKSRGVAAATGAKAWMDLFIDYNYPNNADASMGISMEMKCGFDGT